MKSERKLKIAIMAVLAIALSCGTANARRWHHRPCRIVTVAPKPAVTIQITNCFTQKERFGMAMAYLKNHDYLTVNKYAKMTGLSKTAAKAELDAFAADRNKPVAVVIRNNKNVYVTGNMN